MSARGKDDWEERHPKRPSRARHYAIRAPSSLVGLTRFELVTPRLSSVCSNQLSYRPRYSLSRNRCRFSQNWIVRAAQQSLSARSIFEMANRGSHVSRKEVIQPQVLLQLPCYDFTPITDHTLGASLPCGLM